jgi:hypothetical protein
MQGTLIDQDEVSINAGSLNPSFNSKAHLKTINVDKKSQPSSKVNISDYVTRQGKSTPYMDKRNAFSPESRQSLHNKILS